VGQTETCNSGRGKKGAYTKGWDKLRPTTVAGGIKERTQRECGKPRSATEVMGRYGEWKGELRSIHEGSATNQDLRQKLWGGVESGRGNYGAYTKGVRQTKICNLSYGEVWRVEGGITEHTQRECDKPRSAT